MILQNMSGSVQTTFRPSNARIVLSEIWLVQHPDLAVKAISCLIL